MDAPLGGPRPSGRMEAPTPRDPVPCLHHPQGDRLRGQEQTAGGRGWAWGGCPWGDGSTAGLSVEVAPRGSGLSGPAGPGRATHAADHGRLLVGTGPEQRPQQDLEVLRDVVLGVEQQHRQQLRGLHPGPRHPVGDVVTDGGKHLGEVSEDQLPAAQGWAALCTGKTRGEPCRSQPARRRHGTCHGHSPSPAHPPAPR